MTKMTRDIMDKRIKAIEALNAKGLDMDRKQIEKSGGMKYHHAVPNKTQSLYTVGGSKVLHKSTGGDKFTQQARYARAMSK